MILDFNGVLAGALGILKAYQTTELFVQSV
jgi:hypothetical protein